MAISRWKYLVLLVFGFGLSYSAHAQLGAPAGNKVVPGWYLGMPVIMHAKMPALLGGDGPEAPSDKYPDLVVYLTGPADKTAGTAPDRMIPTPDGPKALPPHQDTVTQLVGKDDMHDALAYFVIPGPKANSSNTKVQPDPGNSVPGAPLVEEIRVGPVWVKLNSHVVIEYGIKAGLLATKPFPVDIGGYGGLMWHTMFDADMSSWNATCATEN